MSEATSVNVKQKGPENGAVPRVHLDKEADPLTELDTESPPDTPRCIEDDGFNYEEPPVKEIERDLDTLTLSGSAINDLEVQLIHARQRYQTCLNDYRQKIDELRRKLNSHIKKTEPFIEIWRRARQAQEESNKAAMRFDKANSQHAASKEMIRMAESQLAGRPAKGADPGSPSPIDQAWQEMLNHATRKVVETERERRASELEHRAVLEKVRKVMEEYRSTEKRLRTHIIKSKPYYEERHRANERLQELRQRTVELEKKIEESKHTYTSTLKKLEVLNTEIHHRRANSQSLLLGQSPVDLRVSCSTGSSPRLTHRHLTDSLDSVRVPAGFSGSVGSLPSISVPTTPTPPLTEPSPSPPTPELTAPPNSQGTPLPNTEQTGLPTQEQVAHPKSEQTGPPSPEQSAHPKSEQTGPEQLDDVSVSGQTPTVSAPSPEELLAHKLVSQCLTAAVHTVTASS